MDFSGLERLIAELPTLADQAVRAIALEVEAAAKKKAPVDTGLLKSSIRMEDPARGDFEARVVVGAEHGIHVHQGARGRKPVPFLAEAVSEAQPRAEIRLQALGRRLEEM